MTTRGILAAALLAIVLCVSDDATAFCNFYADRATIPCNTHVGGSIEFAADLPEGTIIMDYSIDVIIDKEGIKRRVVVKTVIGDVWVEPKEKLPDRFEYAVCLLKENGEYLFTEAGLYRLVLKVGFVTLGSKIPVMVSNTVLITVTDEIAEADYIAAVEGIKTVTSPFQEYLTADTASHLIERDHHSALLEDYLLYQGADGHTVRSYLEGRREEGLQLGLDRIAAWASARCVDDRVICAIWRGLDAVDKGDQRAAEEARQRIRLW